MTRIDHQSGTDRLAEAAASLPPDTLVVNVQGDEPLIEPEVIDRAVAAARLGDAEIVTLRTQLDRPRRDRGSQSREGGRGQARIRSLFFSFAYSVQLGPLFSISGCMCTARVF